MPVQVNPIVNRNLQIFTQNRQHVRQLYVREHLQMTDDELPGISPDFIRRCDAVNLAIQPYTCLLFNVTFPK